MPMLVTFPRESNVLILIHVGIDASSIDKCQPWLASEDLQFMLIKKMDLQLRLSPAGWFDAKHLF